MRFFATLSDMTQDDFSLTSGQMTLECWPSAAVRFLKEDGVTALWHGATISDSETPLTLYVDPVPEKAGPFTVTLKGDMDDAFNRPTDYLTGRAVLLDLDVDADNDGAIGEADDPLEETPGGIQATGTVKQVALRLAPAGLTGTLKLLAVSGGSRIRLWRDAGKTSAVTMPAEWELSGGYTFPTALYVEGIEASAAVRDVHLRLRYTAAEDQYLDDNIRLTILKVDLDIDSVSEADEETVGGFVPVNADNDNGSTVTHHIPATRDFDTDGYTDDDLVPIFLSLEPATGLSGTLRLRKVEGGRDRVKVWETTGKATEVPLPKTWTVGTDTIPATLYVEGSKEGQALRGIDLVLEYLQGGTVLCDDKVKVTVTPVLKTLQASGSGSPWFNAGQSLLFAGTGVGISLSGETYQDGLPSGVLSLIQHLKYGNHLADGAGTITCKGTKKKADHTGTAYRGMALVDVPASGTLPWYVLADGGTPWEFSADDNPQLAIVAPQMIDLIDNDPTSKTLVGVSFLFDIYAAWTFPSANPNDRVVYFLGKADWSVRYDGDFKKVSGSVVYTAGAQNAIANSTGFSRQNGNERTEGPTANEQIGDTWVDP